MSEQSGYQWPTAETVHGWFGKHPTDAVTDKIQDLREAMHDNAADIPEGVYRAVAKQYDEATNGSLCPCGSKATYQGCCKEDWIRVVRWRKQARQEAKAEKKAGHNAEKEASEGDTQWLIRIGYDKKTGVVKFAAVPGQKLDEMDPLALRGAVKSVYDRIDQSVTSSEIAEMVLPKVLQLLAEQAQAQGPGQQGVNLLNP